MKALQNKYHHGQNNYTYNLCTNMRGVNEKEVCHHNSINSISFQNMRHLSIRQNRSFDRNSKPPRAYLSLMLSP